MTAMNQIGDRVEIQSINRSERSRSPLVGRWENEAGQRATSEWKLRSLHGLTENGV